MTRTTDRLEWIKRRNAIGFDWSEAVEAMAQVKVETAPEGLIVDMSAINTRGEYWPTTALLTPLGDDEWLHAPSGQRAPLVEWLWTMTLFAIDDGFNPVLKVGAALHGDSEEARDAESR